MRDYELEGLKERLMPVLAEFDMEHEVDSFVGYVSALKEFQGETATSKATSTIAYKSNNSGGDWWLDDDDWRNLERLGWVVDWKDSRWLGALAVSAKREGVTMEQAREEFYAATGQTGYEEGCSCCGAPHWFSEED